MGECFGNEISSDVEKYEIEVTKVGPLFLRVYFIHYPTLSELEVATGCQLCCVMNSSVA